MSENTIPAPLDDAQLRFLSLMEYVDLVQKNWAGDFPGANSLNSLVIHFSEMAHNLFGSFEQALEKVNKEDEKRVARHRMVDKLSQEWEVIYKLISSAKFLGATLETRKDISWLDLIISTAQNDLNLSNWNFIVVPRMTQRFALTRFKYASEFAALDMPFSTFNSAWEWGIFWHELAGRKIKELKENNRRNPFLIRSVSGIEKTREQSGPELLEQVAGKLESDQSVAQAELKKIKEVIQTPPAPGWSQDWVEELFEDACSVLTFGEVFLPVLETILQRSENSDTRHPPVEVRKRIASRLLDKTVHSSDPEQEKIESDVVKRLFKLINDNGLKLPFASPDANLDSGTDIHRELRELMAKFNNRTASLGDTRNFKDKLKEILIKGDGYKRYQPPDANEKVEEWEEVKSGNYKKMLAINLSEGDAFGPTTHNYTDHINYGTYNPLTGQYTLTVYYTDTNGINHSHTHSY